MPTPEELEQKFWTSITSDMTVMIGLDGVEEGHMRPMTALVEEGRPPIWFFTSRDTAIASVLTTSKRATASFTSKDHDLFATLHGSLVVDNDRAVIDRLWSPFVAAWFEGGKDDPKLVLLRFDAERAHIWENATSFFAGIRLLLGADPKKEYRDKVAEVSLR
ncbi:pyridoxamine 5'-phosphate oxidase family protein [Hyphomicrobium sp. LHD-15]|uniref:pyridoxamine 5'-phosphate oxidase family protein n=1 Tax=Hyphomicrobium sp. LHD-15 TaxID=3072142 RepID=UPI00280C55A3|nr:pyridoxamine 5'-phosphate oxidase family protein [Hyphomicrobium sp. LHD-15]MDQ8697492.1 pyridoxamine 5'-phosphate oxidase family protein [Hyphomicrobium sp. LHD-15]